MTGHRTAHKIAQARLNQKYAEKRLLWLIHNNFTENDVTLTLTYRTSPGNVEEAQRTLTNFIRRIKRLRARLGFEPLKYVTITELTRPNGRIIHRVIMDAGLGCDVLKELWHFGFIDVQRLRTVGLAMYFVKDRQTYRRWNSSRSLIFPR